MFGLLLHIFGKPTRGELPGDDYNDYHDWLDESLDVAGELTGQGLAPATVHERPQGRH